MKLRVEQLKFFPVTVKLESSDLAFFFDVPVGSVFELSVCEFNGENTYVYNGSLSSVFGFKMLQIDAVKMIKLLNKNIFKNEKNENDD